MKELRFFTRTLFSSIEKEKTSGTSIKSSVIVCTISFIVLIITLSTGLGLNKHIFNRASHLTGHIIINHYQNDLNEETHKPINNVKTEIEIPLKKNKNINHIQYYITKPGIIEINNNFEGLLFKGISKNYKLNTLKKLLIKGKLPNFNKKIISKEVLISEKTANKLNLKTGDSFKTYFFKKSIEQTPNIRFFKIAGIFNTSFKDFDDNFIITDIKQLQKINKWDSLTVGGAEVFLKNYTNLSKDENKIHHTIDPSLKAFSLETKYPVIFEWIKMFYLNIIIIFIIIIIVVGINISTTLLTIITEKTQEIGILKTLGANNTVIKKIFIRIILYIIGKGLLYGNTIGITILLIQKKTNILKLDTENYYSDYVPVFLNWQMVILLNLGLLITCTLILTIPAIIINKISPKKALEIE